MTLSAKTVKLIEASSTVTRMFEEGARLKAAHGPDKVFDFSLGNPDVPPPPEFGEVMKNLTGDYARARGYTPAPGLPRVRAAVAEYLSRDHGITIPPDCLIMTPGAVGALNDILEALLDPGDEVVIPAPYFVGYSLYVLHAEGILKAAPTKADFHLDCRAVEEAVNERTKAVLINSPNNPAGVVYSRGELKELAEVLDRASRKIGRRIYLISDEPYRKLAFGAEIPSVLQIYPHTILVSSYSKQLSLAGERIGYLVVHPEAENAALVTKAAAVTNSVLYVNAPSLFQLAVAEIPGAVVDVSAYKRKRDLFCEGLKGAGYDVNIPEGGFFLFPKSPLPDERAFSRLLMEELILVAPGSDFGTPGFFRLSFAVPGETIRGAMAGFGRALEKAGGA